MFLSREIFITEVGWTSSKSNPSLSGEIWAHSCQASPETYGMDLICLFTPAAAIGLILDRSKYPAHISGKKELSHHASSTDEKACQ